MEIKPEHDAEMKRVIAEVQLHQKPRFQLPIIVRNNYLLWAHLQRLHNELSPSLRLELDELLSHVDKITTAMIEIASVREWFETSKSLIEFRRSLIQALDIKSNNLIQIPHFSEETVKHCLRGGNPCKDILNFLEREPENRRGVNDMTEIQLADVNEFCKHMTRVKVECVANVEGEKTICKDDIATVSVKITRENLEDGTALGYVHAPYYPKLHIEEWYFVSTMAFRRCRI